MNALALARAIDDVATADPERLGYGYADTQHPWRHRPAIAHARDAFHELLRAVAARGLRGTFVQVGGRAGMQRALALLGTRVVRVGGTASEAGDEPARLPWIPGDPCDPAVAAAVRAAAPSCDLVLLDGDSTYAARRAEHALYAPLVRPGGLVAIADLSQACPEATQPFDVDRFVADLERDVLAPRGVRCRRFGGAHAIWCYVQGDHSVPSPPMPEGLVLAPAPTHAGTARGFSIHAVDGGFVAVPGEDAVLDPRALARNEHAVVLRAATGEAAHEAVAAWTECAPLLAAAREHLAAGRIAEAEGLAAAAAERRPALRAVLLASLAAAPHCKELLLALGTLTLFRGAARLGAAYLRRALDQDLLDRVLLPCLGNAYQFLVRDADAARRLLEEARRATRRHRLAVVCRERLRGHVLWQYPQLLEEVRGVLQVGAGSGEEVAAFDLLGIEERAFLEPQPQAFAALQRRCAARAGRDVLLPVAAGDRPGERVLHVPGDPQHASFLPLREGAPRTPLRVPVHTLDELVAQGRFDPTRYNLLFVDTEGTELEVLRGAREVLHHVDLVCVAVLFRPIYEGAPLPQDIQAFLRTAGGDGFALRAIEPGDDPARGDAVFRRLRRRHRA